ncbi:MAG: hypothetical protein KDL87_18680, partial [Verrucomicrobiae bacterium]|nr:hypothetical protein [Verrucomicrobiae bacterium]
MNWFRQTNSWHWLLMSMAVCLAIAAYGCLTVWKKAAEKNGPILQGMQTHADQLVLLVEEDALLIEHQVSEIQKRTNDYEAAARAKVGAPIPQGESSVLHLSNEINRALQKH